MPPSRASEPIPLPPSLLLRSLACEEARAYHGKHASSSSPRRRRRRRFSAPHSLLFHPGPHFWDTWEIDGFIESMNNKLILFYFFRVLRSGLLFFWRLGKVWRMGMVWKEFGWKYEYICFLFSFFFFCRQVLQFSNKVKFFNK